MPGNRGPSTATKTTFDSRTTQVADNGTDLTSTFSEPSALDTDGVRGNIITSAQAERENVVDRDSHIIKLPPVNPSQHQGPPVLTKQYVRDVVQDVLDNAAEVQKEISVDDEIAVNETGGSPIVEQLSPTNLVASTDNPMSSNLGTDRHPSFNENSVLRVNTHPSPGVAEVG